MTSSTDSCVSCFLGFSTLFIRQSVVESPLFSVKDLNQIGKFESLRGLVSYSHQLFDSACGRLLNFSLVADFWGLFLSIRTVWKLPLAEVLFYSSRFKLNFSQIAFCSRNHTKALGSPNSWRSLGALILVNLSYFLVKGLYLFPVLYVYFTIVE